MSDAKRPICWQCNKKLEKTWAEIPFNGSVIKTHKTCKEDAENLLLKDKVTFMGIGIEAIAKPERRGDEQD